MKPETGNPTTAEEDPENPTWTAEDFANAVPFQDAHPDLYRSWQQKVKRSKTKALKVKLALRLSSDVVQAVKATGDDYNDRVEVLLRDAIARGVL